MHQELTMPNAGLDANGNLWLCFSAYTENVDNGIQYLDTYISQNLKMVV